LFNVEPTDAAARELFEETGLTMTFDDLILLSGASIRLPLPDGKHQLVYAYSASVHVPHVKAYFRTPTKVEQAAIAESTGDHDGSYVIPTTIDIDGGLSLTSFVTCLVKESQRTHELQSLATWLNGNRFEQRCCLDRFLLTKTHPTVT
jgi:ADP-ribose pyrophosphatase YjhB (NUDIX family)